MRNGRYALQDCGNTLIVDVHWIVPFLSDMDVPDKPCKCLLIMQVPRGLFPAYGCWDGERFQLELYPMGVWRSLDSPKMVGWVELTNGLAS